jgi:hypothetical protein
MDIPITVYAFFGVAALGLFYALNLGKRDSRMPPGPPTIPILGNAHQIPSTGLYKQLVQYPRCIDLPSFTLTYRSADFANGPNSTVLSLL